MKRKEGYYWAKYDGFWLVAEYFIYDMPHLKPKGVWWMANVERDYKDSDFDEINENRILSPDELSTPDIPEFVSLDTYVAGKSHARMYAVEAHMDMERGFLVGKDVRIDGFVYKVLAVESYNIPKILKGQKIGLMV